MILLQFSFVRLNTCIYLHHGVVTTRHTARLGRNLIAITGSGELTYPTKTFLRLRITFVAVAAAGALRAQYPSVMLCQTAVMFLIRKFSSFYGVLRARFTTSDWVKWWHVWLWMFLWLPSAQWRRGHLTFLNWIFIFHLNLKIFILLIYFYSSTLRKV